MGGEICGGLCVGNATLDRIEVFPLTAFFVSFHLSAFSTRTATPILHLLSLWGWLSPPWLSIVESCIVLDLGGWNLIYSSGQKNPGEELWLAWLPSTATLEPIPSQSVRSYTRLSFSHMTDVLCWAQLYFWAI